MGNRVKSNDKPVEGRAFSRFGTIALLAFTAAIPIVATAAVSAETIDQAEGQNLAATTNAAAQQPAADPTAPVVTPPPSGAQESPVQPEAAPAAADPDRPDESLDGPPTRDRVWQAICAAGIQHPEIVMKQAMLETGNFRAPMLMSRNNLFGFRTQAYLRFENWQESVAYYKRWQDRRYTNRSENYFRFLDRIRYASPGYQSHVTRMSWERSCPA